MKALLDRSIPLFGASTEANLTDGPKGRRHGYMIISRTKNLERKNAENRNIKQKNAEN
jgi:hypothetical protein